jgi:alkanesulfonate monooxygenase SsuD/methylene tetrahydromethanopterin reductase-like flavin-dependent oxidoreductase (luciferase family)
MRPNPAEGPRGLITELRAALDAIPADEPRNYLRQSLQVLLPLLEQLHRRLQALEARMEALESGPRPPDGILPSAPSGDAKLRKYLLTAPPLASGSPSGAKAIAAIATVWVTSEAADAPIDHAFDQHGGPGGSRWVAAGPGEQRLILAFDTPQPLRRISLEVEEAEVSRTQVLHVSVSSDGGQTYQELRRQEYTFSPPGTTFEREEWAVTVEGATHLQLVITPDKGGVPCRATLTSLALY